MFKEKLSRRDFLREVSLLAAGSVLAACGPKPTPTPAKPAEKPTEAPPAPTTAPPAAEGATVEFWVGWGELTPMFDNFKQMKEWKELISPNDVQLKPAVSDEVVLTAIAGGAPPAVLSEAPYFDLMARGVLAPIDDWVAASSIVKKENFISGNWERGFWQGVQYGVPALECFVPWGLDYNARMVEAAGLDPDKPPVTWDECLEWHKALTKFDNAGNLLQIGLDPYDAEGGALGDGFLTAASWGFKWFDEETGKFDLNNDKMAEAFEVVGEFYRIAGPDNIAGMRSVEGQDTWGGSFNAEVQAMIIEGYWHPGETMIQKPEVAKYNRATWVPMPEARRGVKIQGTRGHYIILCKEAKNIEVGFKFAEFLNTDAACDLIFKQVGWLPAYIPYLDGVDPSTYPGLDFYFRSIHEADEIHPLTICPVTNFAETNYNELAEKVYRDEMTGSEAAAEFQKRCEDEYKAAGFG